MITAAMLYIKTDSSCYFCRPDKEDNLTVLYVFLAIAMFALVLLVLLVLLVTCRKRKRKYFYLVLFEKIHHTYLFPILFNHTENHGKKIQDLLQHYNSVKME